MQRYIFLIRERSEQARQRIGRMSGYEIAKQLDAFEARPRSKWSPSPVLLAALEDTALANLETSAVARGQAPIIEMPSSDSIASTGNDNTARSRLLQSAVLDGGDIDILQKAVDSAANWFYWVAGLTLANIVTAMLGSEWGFAVGLGISQIMIATAMSMAQSADNSFMLIGMLWVGGIAFAAFFAECGWLARRPSVVAFVIGIGAFALDSLIYLSAADWIGMGFHALALYFLWNGLSAARKIRREPAA